MKLQGDKNPLLFGWSYMVIYVSFNWKGVFRDAQD